MLTLNRYPVSQIQSLLKKINAIKTDKSPGPDQLHSRVLFEVRNEIVAPLTRLFKLSVDTATLPYDWKIGEITASDTQEWL